MRFRKPLVGVTAGGLGVGLYTVERRQAAALLARSGQVIGDAMRALASNTEADDAVEESLVMRQPGTCPFVKVLPDSMVIITTVPGEHRRVNEQPICWR